ALRPDLVVTDISMPNMDGIEAIAKIKQFLPSAKCVVISMHDSPDHVQRAHSRGACGFIGKDAPPHEFAAAISSVMTRGRYFSPEMTRRLYQTPEPTAADDLTPRQL